MRSQQVTRSHDAFHATLQKDNVALLQNSSNKDAKAKEVQFIIQQVDAREFMLHQSGRRLALTLSTPRFPFHGCTQASCCGPLSRLCCLQF